MLMIHCTSKNAKNQLQYFNSSQQLTFLSVFRLWSSIFDEIKRVTYSVSAAVPAPQQLYDKIND